jgi:hypothetical protein
LIGKFERMVVDAVDVSTREEDFGLLEAGTP